MKVKNLADWLKANPNAKVNLVGYADAQTGNSNYNQKLSQERVDRVAKHLIEKYGISESRIATSAKGDKEQPFCENSKNRVVLGLAK